MRTIHRVDVKTELQWRLDADRGMVKDSVSSLQQGSAERITHNGETYKITSDGTFTVPDDLAGFLLGQPGWHEGPNPFVELLEIDAAETVTPRKRAPKTSK